jgi:hypothetical protein
MTGSQIPSVHWVPVHGIALMPARIVTVVSHVAELTIFFAAAAALGAGLLGLR